MEVLRRLRPARGELSSRDMLVNAHFVAFPFRGRDGRFAALARACPVPAPMPDSVGRQISIPFGGTR